MKPFEYVYFLDEKTKITIRCSNESFAICCVHFVKDAWVCIARIDNCPHKGTENKTHIHRYKQKKVEYRELSIEEAQETVIRIGKHIIGDLHGN